MERHQLSIDGNKTIKKNFRIASMFYLKSGKIDLEI